MENGSNIPAATFESVWAGFKETERLLKVSSENFDRWLKESSEASERDRKKSNEDFDRRFKKIEKTLGSWANNQGEFAEEYFFNSFENGKQNFFGETFDRIEKNFKGVKEGIRDEYDLILINGKSVGIIEVKYKAHLNDIPDVLRKAYTFRKIFSDFANHQVYLGLASLSFYPELEEECVNEGIAVIKQVGESVVVNDEHLKIF